MLDSMDSMDSMSEKPRTRGRVASVLRKSRAAGVIAALAMSASLVAVPAASADSNPSVADLLNACSWADLCQFHPTNYWTYTGPEHQVGDVAYNCTGTVMDHQVGFSDTTGSTNSVGVQISASVKFWTVYEASVTASYGHSWESSHTDNETNTVHIRPNYVGWLTRGTAKQHADGWYEIHFGSRQWGHYYWYINNYVSTGEDVDHWWMGFVAGHDRPMSWWEGHQHCGW